VTLRQFLTKLYVRLQDPTRWADHLVPVHEQRWNDRGELVCGCVIQHMDNLRSSGYVLDVGIAVVWKHMLAIDPAIGATQGVGIWNDTHTYDQVLQAVRGAMREVAC
jgi:hypothetical protein